MTDPKDLRGLCFEVPGSLYGPIRFYEDSTNRDKFISLGEIGKLVGASQETLHKVFGLHPYRVNGIACLKVDSEWKSLMAKLTLRDCAIGHYSQLKYVKSSILSDLKKTAKHIAGEGFPAISCDGRMNAVSAKDLYAYLEIPFDYKFWISACFDNVDAGTAKIHLDYEETTDGDFALSIPLAKRMSMLSKGVKAEQIRSYFLWVENQAEKGQTQQLQETGGFPGIFTALKAIQDQTRINQIILNRVDETHHVAVESLKVQKSLLDAMVSFGGRLDSLEGSQPYSLVTQVARNLDVSRTDLFLRLKQMGWVEEHGTAPRWRPSTMGVKEGFLIRGNNKGTRGVVLTSKGQDALKVEFQKV